MDRRRFLLTSLAGALVAPIYAGVQQAAKAHRVGILFPYVATDPLTEEMRQAFRDLGYFEGRTIAIEWRHIGGDTARLPALVAESCAARRKRDRREYPRLGTELEAT